MAGKRKVYTAEFKLLAVKMITEPELSVAEVTRRLGVTENRLHEWKKVVAKKGAEAPLLRTSDACRRVRPFGDFGWSSL
ncbi:MAG TPA: transposase [Gemmata sp.]